MHIYLRLGVWKHQVHVDFSQDVADQLLNRGYENGVDLMFMERTLMIAPGGSVNLKEGSSYHARNKDYPIGFDFNLDFAGNVATYHPITTLDATLGQHGDIVAELPDIHELPWPSKAWELTDDEWVEIIAQRIISADLAGVEIKWPDHVIGMRKVFKMGWARSREKEAA